jgi:hypothetical protein
VSGAQLTDAAEKGVFLRPADDHTGNNVTNRDFIFLFHNNIKVYLKCTFIQCKVRNIANFV